MNTHTRSHIEQQTIALAGAVQAIQLVDRIASTGGCSPEFAEASLHSLFRFDADTVEAVYGGIGGVRSGLKTLATLLTNAHDGISPVIPRYLFNLLYLERKYSADSNMMKIVRSRLEHSQFRTENFAAELADISHSVAAIYEDTLSKMAFRIKIAGSPEHLQNSRNADMIRALLLAGLRSVFLWRQLGGRRWKLFLQRKTLLENAQNLSRDARLV
ncbi:MAG: high frequency lysogenization protein HflD [Parahaliea sp.]